MFHLDTSHHRMLNNAVASTNHPPMMTPSSVRQFVSCLLVLFVLAPLSVAKAAEPVSLISLIANPDRYQGKDVLVSGYLTLEKEGKALYLYEADYLHAQFSNGLWVDIDIGAYQQHNRQYIVIEGEFDVTDKGHMGLWSGSLKNIERVFVAPKPQ